MGAVRAGGGRGTDVSILRPKEDPLAQSTTMAALATTTDDSMDSEMESVLLSSPDKGTKARASSILQGKPKVYGPSLALTNTSACWNSEGNTEEPHWFRLDFQRRVEPTRIALQFQAGFTAQQVTRIEYQSDGRGDWQVWDEDLECDDTHELQLLDLSPAREAPTPCTALRFVLEDCTDFYGRVILYQLQVWGHEVDQ